MEKYIGKILNDRYMITEVIGVGGMAYVYKAFDKVCNRVVAVKILKDEFMSDAQFRRRFTNESKAITMLSQSNIVDVYDVSLEGDALYIVMEYIDGITLKEYMDKKGALSSAEALHFVKQILKGLAHAHERGIVHRDIKPHNIILLKDGTIKITDFGIARLTKFDTQTISDMAIGSVHYISPEQASGDRTDARSDIYSVGIILYEMLTGKLPFEADTAVAVALKQVQAQPELPTEINPSLPQGLEDITLKAMMKDPAIRYQSAGAFLADIAQFEADPTITFHYVADPIEDVPNLDNSPTIFAEGIVPGSGIPAEAGSDAVLEEEEEEGAEEEEEGEKPSFKNTWLPIIAGVGTAFVVLILVALGIIFQKELFGSKKVACPNVVGMELEKAKDEYNFEFVVESTVASDQYAEGQIIYQNPEADTQIKKKSKITVVVSSGPESTQKPDNSTSGTNYVPDVVKKTRAEAIAEFKRQEISYKIETKPSDEIEEGRVINTSPTAGKEINDDTTVIIYISSGPEETETNDPPVEVQTVTMPDLSNMTEEAAKTTLKNNKLELGNVTKDYHDTIEAGKVISQSVLKDKSVEEGTKIDIVISLGPKPVEKPDPEPEPDQEMVTVTVDLSKYKEEQSVKVSVKTESGTVIYNKDVIPENYKDQDYKLRLEPAEYEVGTVIVVSINGELVDTITVKKST
ncbi:MAG: Stk1 family PASTA domain-containing Ser/Thr kinase [Clostridiales bacterium]|nr:MAG: Stk1 family PASTA domain-containing Ser/Thr kinase [Clostridiales bacterium]